MLELKVYDGDRQATLMFEHSLRSVSKWEQKYKKPFLHQQHSALEMTDYFQEMLLNDEDPTLVYALSPEQLEELVNYINDPASASSVPKEAGRPSPEQITSELLYYWMMELKIDWEAQDWHLNRLMMLVRIANFKRQPPKKQKLSDFRSEWQAKSEANRKKLQSNG